MILSKGHISRIVNHKYRFINSLFGTNEFLILDIGAGNHSASRIKKSFPSCRYYGLDITRDYSNSEVDFRVMDGFYELDLTKLDFASIPDNHFDFILISHVIEHLFNGDKVLALLMKKLKSGGWMYVEYPGKKSLKLPSMKGTLNFNDDPTHVRVYSISELEKVFESNEGIVRKSGTRRNYYYILAMPFRILLSLIGIGKLQGNLFWDILGFAEYLKIQKKDKAD